MLFPVHSASGYGGVHADILFSVQSASGDREGLADMLLSVQSHSETVGAMQSCSAQFSQLVEIVAGMQTGLSQSVSF